MTSTSVHRGAVFRPSLSRPFTQAVVATVLLYFGLLLVRRAGLELEYPFGIAALVGLAVFGFNAITQVRRHGFAVDDRGILDIHSGQALAFSDIQSIRVAVEDIPVDEHIVPIRVAILEGPGVTLRFAELGPRVGPRIGDVANLGDAGLLLAIIAAQTGSTSLHPDTWNPTTTEGEAAASIPTAPSPPARPRPSLGIIAFLIKAGPKLFTVALKLLKSIKPAAAAVTVGAYGLLISWEFAFAFLLLIGVHECGHVYAMWKSGVKVRGVYFVPFLGAVAVGEGPAQSAGNDAYISINGPVWGTAMAGLCLGAYAAFDGQWPLLAALAAWGALINLFNLLPIMPLDGGRILGALGASRRWGPAAIFISLLLGGTLAYFAELELLVLMVLLGVTELGNSVRSADAGPGLAMLGARPYDASAHEHFSALVAPVTKGRGKASLVEQRARRFEVFAARSWQAPMTRRQLVTVGVGYTILCASLLTILLTVGTLAGAGDPIELLR